MSVSYNKLWKLLIDKKISVSDLRKSANIAPNTMTKMRRDEDVSLAVLRRICESLDVDIGDIMEFTRDKERID
ncbi:helix-turn-helix domain-containing protein [Anaerotruncus colihominis]|uniref:helix-turn-helix domain-containing protein n=1 Tax=Anaerotruncus colihominis TaxID=169435 RepID=UPI00189B2E21|nr:helix-turn-helix transcriptional regulator [Anaerotruncus colihominis]